MNVSIRNSIFETNSSSVHAITIDLRGTRNMPDDEITISLDYYGRSNDDAKIECHNETEFKASYLWTLVNTYARYRKNYDKIFNLSLDEWRERISAVLGYKCSFVEYTEDCDCYIDHDDELCAFLQMMEHDDNALRAFLFSENSKIDITSDESECFYISDYANRPHDCFYSEVGGETIVYIKGN